MSLIDRYHAFVHHVSAAVGYDYGDASPDWVHPIVHLVLVIAPTFLIFAVLSFSTRALIKIWRRPRYVVKQPEYVRGLDLSILATVLRYTKRRQVVMILLSLVAMPILYLTLELPKQIVNNALDSSHFPVSVLGWTLNQFEFLMALSALYLLAISLNGLNKYTLNVMKGYVAESFLRRFRLLAYRQWRRDPTASEKSEIVPILSLEVEPIGGFAADVLTLPIMQGGTLFTILAFMFVQDPILGAAALAVLPIQLILLPKLQRRVNRLSRIRIQEMRRLGRELSHQLHTEQAAASAFSQICSSFIELEKIRRRIFNLKFFIKALNNFLTALTPFFFYSLGGYFVMQDRISLGALVAVLAAHKDFSAPLKELFRYYQMLEDTRVRYAEITNFLRSSPSSEPVCEELNLPPRIAQTA